MKRCPQCATDYFDDMLEFCLEDGAKLFTVSKTSNDETPTITKPNNRDPFTEKTVNLPFSEVDKTLASVLPTNIKNTLKENTLVKEKLAAGYKILEILPLIIALIHNWWQWLYAANQSYPSISAFLLSANFLIWLLLLIIGVGLGLLAVRRCSNKGYALVSLIMLAVNLILFIVPKR